MECSIIFPLTVLLKLSNLGYADDTTLMAERKENLKSFLMKVKEEREKAGLILRSWHLVPSFNGKQMDKKWKQ